MDSTLRYKFNTFSQEFKIISGTIFNNDLIKMYLLNTLLSITEITDPRINIFLFSKDSNQEFWNSRILICYTFDLENRFAHSLFEIFTFLLL